MGPKCARRAGLLVLGKRKAGVVRLVGQQVIAKVPGPRTLDLFGEVPA